MEHFESQHADVMDSLGELHQDECFSDFTLHLKEGPMRFSRLLLASMSPFFHKLVTVDMEESRSNEVHMEHVTQDTWKCISSFYFSSSNLVSIDNVLDVLETSHMYGLEKLVQYCSDFLQSHCCAKNCLDLLELGILLDLESLKQEARRVLADNFSTVCKCESFLCEEKAKEMEQWRGKVVTTKDDLCQALPACLGELQQDRRFLDFTLKLKGGPLRFSRLLLASMSPFFRNLVTVDIEESRSNEVHMEHVTQDTWNCITSFYFSSSKLVSIDNVQDVLETSHMYGLEKLVQYCSEFLQSHCCADNCLDLLKLGTHFDLECLEQEARLVFAENFSTVCKCESFLSLEKAELLELLEEEVVTTEDDLCQALLAWMEKNDADADTCTEVFQQLRLNLLSDECLGSLVLSHNECLRSPSIQSLVTPEKMKRLQSTSNIHTQMKARKRRPRSAKNGLLALGLSFDDENDESAEFHAYIWSFDERRWTRCPAPPPEAGPIISCTVLEETVIVPGRSIEGGIYFFNLETLVWSRGPDPVQMRRAPDMTSIGHKAYVVGGCNHDGILSSIEEYSKASGQWTPTGCLQVATEECGVAALGDTILVVGGYWSELSQLIQTFNVHTRTAAVLNIRLPNPMSTVRAASHGTSAFFVEEQGELVLVREVKGELRVSSPVALENYDFDDIGFGLHVSKSCVRVLGGSFCRSVSCWDVTGKKITDDAVEDLPVVMEGCIALEVNIPPR